MVYFRMRIIILLKILKGQWYQFIPTWKSLEDLSFQVFLWLLFQVARGLEQGSSSTALAKQFRASSWSSSKNPQDWGVNSHLSLKRSWKAIPARFIAEPTTWSIYIYVYIHICQKRLCLSNLMHGQLSQWPILLHQLRPGRSVALWCVTAPNGCELLRLSQCQKFSTVSIDSIGPPLRFRLCPN